jgi:hypothetical protein
MDDHGNRKPGFLFDQIFGKSYRAGGRARTPFSGHPLQPESV